MHTQEKTGNGQQDTLALVLARAESKGDLPIFNASVNKVRKLSSDPDSHAMELAQTIMKDANLSAKLLRLANSPFYSRGLGKISSVSRAVVLLGFDVIKNLCVTLKLIESFEQEHPAVGLHQLVARSYFTAGFVRNMAIKCGIKEAEEAYIFGLLHQLGEIAVAYFTPDRYNAAYQKQKEAGVTWTQAQLDVIGVPFTDVGQKLADVWNFSAKISNTMQPFVPKHKGLARNREELNHALVGLGSDVVGKLYVEHGKPDRSLRELLTSMADVTGIKLDKVEKSLSESFEASCDLAKAYGLNQKVLMPLVSESGDDLRDRMAREMAFYASSALERTHAAEEAEAAQIRAAALQATPSKGEERNASSVSVGGKPKLSGELTEAERVNRRRTQETDVPAIIVGGSTSQPQAGANVLSSDQRGDPMVQLAIIQELTTMVTSGESLNKLFVKILEGLQRGVGFERAMLCLINPERTVYSGRIAMGKNTDALRLAVTGKINDKKDLFAKILVEGSDLFVSDMDDGTWSDMLPPAVSSSSLGTSSFIAGGIRTGMKSIGFFYADNGVSNAPISPDQRRGFQQFVGQARLAVQIRSG